MVHCFDSDIAEKYGIAQAILFHHFYFWCMENERNGRNHHDGLYWSYQSIKALCDWFPYLSKNSIIRALSDLVSAGLMAEGNFNEAAYDRTKWYAITDLGKSIYPKSEMHLPKVRNAITQSQKPIPDSNTDIYADMEIDKSISMSDSQSLTAQIHHVMAEWNEMANKTGIPAVVRIQPNSNRHKWLKARLAEYGEDSILDAIANVQASEYLRNTTFFSFDWFIRPNNFIKVLEGNYGKGKREKPKEDHPEPETKEIVKDDEYYNTMSAEEWIKYFEETYGNDDDKT